MVNILVAKKSRDYGNQPLWNGAISKGKSLAFYAKKWFNNVYNLKKKNVISSINVYKYLKIMFVLNFTY